MATTYGEELLAKAEARAQKRSTRRRFARLFLPFVFATLWALGDLLSARNARLVAGGAGSIRLLFDHVIVVGWTVAFVIAPMAGALKRYPLPSGAALSFVAGPVLSPLLFGTGWHLWQSAIVSIVAALVLLSARHRAR